MNINFKKHLKEQKLNENSKTIIDTFKLYKDTDENFVLVLKGIGMVILNQQQVKGLNINI